MAISPCLRLFCRLAFLLSLAFGGSSAVSAQADVRAVGDDPFPLRAADTSSPRDTLQTFLRDFRESVEAWRAGKSREEVERALARARDTIDFSDVASLGYEARTVIDMSLLREILDRVTLPEFDEIPGDPELATEEGKDLDRWVIPNTKLEIVKVKAGPRAGEYLFSRETVAGLRTYYGLVKNIPYKRGALVGIYEDVVSSPGNWLPDSFRQRLPAWATTVVAGKGLWQWIALLILTGLCIPLAAIALRAGLQWDERHSTRNLWLRFGTPAALIVVVLLAGLYREIVENVIGLLELPMDLISYLVLAVQAAGLAWLLFVLPNRLADALSKQGDGSGHLHFDGALARILFRLFSLVFIVMLGVAAADRIGIPVAPLVAGLGVGGLAVALAVRPTLENVIGGLTLFADRPVRVGDFCRYGDSFGTVERIGLRSTRIRTPEQSLVTVPNSEFSQMHLDNFAERTTWPFRTTLHVRQDTAPEQLRVLLTKL
ncbi:MAG: mechanosensitive ion channel, partial [Rhizobiales bacterium]|nr:mechanosensitive ion channel [Hyphomicrobiales bacterium]